MTNRWNTALAAAACLGLALGLCACGSGEGDSADEAAQAPQASAPVLGGGARQQQEAQREASGAAAPATPAATTGTHGEAVASYLRLVQESDLAGVLAVCDPGHPNTQSLQLKHDNMLKASAETGMDVKSLAGFLTSGADAITFEFVSEDGGVATYRFLRPEQSSVEVTVVRTPDGWRVRPPEGGLPNL